MNINEVTTSRIFRTNETTEHPELCLASDKERSRYRCARGNGCGGHSNARLILRGVHYRSRAERRYPANESVSARNRSRLCIFGTSIIYPAALAHHALCIFWSRSILPDARKRFGQGQICAVVGRIYCARDRSVATIRHATSYANASATRSQPPLRGVKVPLGVAEGALRALSVSSRTVCTTWTLAIRALPPRNDTWGRPCAD